MNDACENTDKKLWAEPPGGYYSNSIHVTNSGGIGMNYGGYVVVKPIKKWIECANLIDNYKLRGVSEWRKKLALWLLKSDTRITYPIE